LLVFGGRGPAPPLLCPIYICLVSPCCFRVLLGLVNIGRIPPSLIFLPQSLLCLRHSQRPDREDPALHVFDAETRFATYHSFFYPRSLDPFPMLFIVPNFGRTFYQFTILVFVESRPPASSPHPSSLPRTLVFSPSIPSISWIPQLVSSSTSGSIL